MVQIEHFFSRRNTGRLKHGENKINTDAKLNKELRNALNGNKLISTQTKEGRNNLFHSASLL